MERIDLIAAYKAANENSRDVLRKLFPEVDFEGKLKAEQRAKIPVTDRVKTFEDACRELGDTHCLVAEYKLLHGSVSSPDLLAYLKLRIVCAALNEGWKPQFTETEDRWYPCFGIYSSNQIDGRTDRWVVKRTVFSINDVYRNDANKYIIVCCDNTCHTDPSIAMSVGSRLALKNHELALYAGRKFIELYCDLYLIRKIITQCNNESK